MKYFMCFFCLSSPLYAYDCRHIFPDAIQNSHRNGSIEFHRGAGVVGSPDNIIDTANTISDDSMGGSCGRVRCTASGSVVNSRSLYEINSFDGINSFDNVDGIQGGGPVVRLGYQDIRSLSPGHYSEINVGTQAVLTMAPGIYVLQDHLILHFQSRIAIKNPGVVSVFVGSVTSVGPQANINTHSKNRSFFLFGRERVHFQSKSNAHAYVFSKSDIGLEKGAGIKGALTADEKISLGNGAFVIYHSAFLNKVTFGDFCEWLPKK